MNNLKIFFVLTICIASLVTISLGQLTYSPNWGKRNPGTQLNNNLDLNAGYSSSDNCKSSVDLLMIIQQLIQGEAQKLRDCHQK